MQDMGCNKAWWELSVPKEEEILEYVRQIEEQENAYHSKGGCVLNTKNMRTLRELLMRDLFGLKKAKALMLGTGIFIEREEKGSDD